MLMVVLVARSNAKHLVSGSGEVAPVPGPPAVGECLLEKTDEAAGWGFGHPLYPGLELAPCAGPRWGEVVSVLPGALTAPTMVTTTDASGVEVSEVPNQGLCSRDLLAYIGVAAGPRFGWSTQIGTTAAIGPTNRQRMAGQSWVGCVIVPVTQGAVAPAPYRGTIRNALTVGTLPSLFASCSDLLTAADFINAACDHPHHLEILGVRTTSASDTQETMDANCRQLAPWLMRNNDPTMLGLLAVKTAAAHIDANTGVPVEGFGPSGDSAKAACWVEPVDSRQLRGTLIGVGTGPIPWA